jgi:hypothetical protein
MLIGTFNCLKYRELKEFIKNNMAKIGIIHMEKRMIIKMKNNENFIYNVDVEQIMQEIKYDIEILKRFKDYLRDHYIGEIYQNKPVWHFITYVSLFGDMFYQQYHVIRD